MDSAQRLSSALPNVLVDMPALIERAMQQYVESGRAGKLTAAEARALIDGSAVIKRSRELSALPPDRVIPLIRHVYTRSVSWALYTREYLDSLHKLLEAMAGESASGRAVRVLEVCAGGGMLARCMRERGIVWMATDANPPASAADDVSQRGALAAVQDAVQDAAAGGSAVDVVFFAWWSEPKAKKPKKRKHDLAAAAAEEDAPTPVAAPAEDRLVAEHCAAAGVPIVFVSEPVGGITGSSELWQAGGPYAIEPACDHVDGFEDVANWDGFADRTWVLRPRAKPAEEDVGEKPQARGVVADVE